MAVITDGNYVISPIENTIMLEKLRDGILYAYFITPVEGYVIHDKARDWQDLDPDTLEETNQLGYTRGTVSCSASYDFMANPREFYAVPEDSVPADHIFGGAGNDHVVA